MTRTLPWPRILAEGVIIVVSILLAFGIDAWWDGLKEDASREQLLEALRTEFEGVRDELIVGIPQSEFRESQSRALLSAVAQGTDLSLDSIRQLAIAVTTGLAVEVSALRYDVAKASGEIGLIDDDSLLLALSGFDDVRGSLNALAETARTMAFSGSTYDLRRELGSLSVLAVGGGRAGVADLFVPNDLMAVLRRKPVYAALEVGHVLNSNLTERRRSMLSVVERVLASIGDKSN